VAAELDATIEARKQDLDRARTAASESGAVAEKSRLEVQQLRREIRVSEETVGRLNEWLRVHRATGELAERWSACERELERFERIRSRVREIEAENQGIGAALSSAHSEHIAVDTKAAEARNQLAVVISGAEEAERAAAAGGAANAAKQLRDETRRLNRLAKLVEVGERFQAASEAETRAAALASLAQERHERATAESTAAGEVKIALDAELAELEWQLSQARLAEQLESERAELRDGEPCVLCGALEHPWADRPPRNAGAARELEAKVKGIRRRYEESVASEVREQQRAEAEKRAAEERVLEAEKHRLRAAAAVECWKTVVTNFSEESLTGDLPAPGSLDRVTELFRASEETIERLDRASRESLELIEAADVARRNADEVREVASAAEKTLQQVALHVARLEGDARTNAEALKRERALEDEALDSLEEAFRAVPEWRNRLVSGPDAFVRARRAEVEEWKAKKAAADTAGAAVARLREQLVVAEASHQQAWGHASADVAAMTTLGTVLDRLTTDRQRLLEGRKTEEVRREMDSAVDQATSAAQSAEHERVEAVSAAAATEAREAAARETACTSDAAFADADAALRAEISSRGLDFVTIRECLSRDESWIATREAEVEKVRRARSEARVILEERARRRLVHEATGYPSTPAAELSKRREERIERAASVESDLARVKGEIDLDDLRRMEHDALVPRIESQRERCGLWKSVSDLIGSKDGKAFRKFAQSLTLDVLVDHANEHLKLLARRYRLERVPGHALDLQVIDRELGDEVRTVNGLSGGETFLVSLGLALGLASLAKTDVPIESLFIDEGFGSLDPETLDSALCVLDALHDGSRRIGLISHVPGLAERVGVQIRVTPGGAGTSTIEVMSES
jgi:exonuclease SbcC